MIVECVNNRPLSCLFWDLAWLRTHLVVTTIKLFIAIIEIFTSRRWPNVVIVTRIVAWQISTVLFAALLLDLYKLDGVKQGPLLAVLL